VTTHKLWEANVLAVISNYCISVTNTKLISLFI